MQKKTKKKKKKEKKFRVPYQTAKYYEYFFGHRTGILVRCGDNVYRER